MVMDANGRSHRAKGLPKGYAGTYDGNTAAAAAADVTPPAAYYDGRMNEDDRLGWAEGMDALNDRHVGAPRLPDGLDSGRWHNEFGDNVCHAGGCTFTLGDGADPDVRVFNRSRIANLPLSVVRARLGGADPKFDFGDRAWRPDPDELADMREAFGVTPRNLRDDRFAGLLGPDPVEGSISSVADTYPGANARLYADFVRHPRRRSYTLEGEAMSRARTRDYARGMFVESARNDAKAWGDDYDPADVAERAGRWFDERYPAPKRL